MTSAQLAALLDPGAVSEIVIANARLRARCRKEGDWWAADYLRRDIEAMGYKLRDRADGSSDVFQVRQR